MKGNKPSMLVAFPPQACRENHVDVVELLLDYGASVNAPFPNSRLVRFAFHKDPWGVVGKQWSND